MENLNIHFEFANFSLSVQSSETVNKISVGYLLANIPMLAATITINLWVIKVIKGKEKSRINKLIIWDCFANILTMAIMLAIHSPLLPLSSTVPCAILVFVVYTMSWNRVTKSLNIVICALPRGLGCILYIVHMYIPRPRDRDP